MAIDISKLKAKQAAFRAKMQEIVQSDPWVEIKFLVGNVLTPFKLEYSFGSVQEVYRSTGKNLNAGEIQVSDMQDIEMLIVLLTEGLKTHHPDITVEKVAGMFRMKHLLYYLDCVQQAMQAVQPDYASIEAMFGEVDGSGEEGPSPLPEVLPS